MPRVHTTKEYEKCLKRLLTRGKIGKNAYDKARVAEAEARQGSIWTVPRTHHGEDRIPDAEKYDLPGDYRLVVQRVNDIEPGRVFLFVGSHDEAEKWLRNNRKLRSTSKPGRKQTPNTVSPLKQESQRPQQQQKSSQSERQQQAADAEKPEVKDAGMSENPSAREETLEQPTAQMKESEGKPAQIVPKDPPVLPQRVVLVEHQPRQAGEQACRKANIQQHTSKLARRRRSVPERENQTLRRHRQPSREPTNSRLRWTAAVAGGGILILAFVLLANMLFRSSSGNEQEQPGIKDAETTRRPVIQPAEAPRWEGQEVTVRVVVKSTYDGFDWAFMINSENDFRHPDNFTVIVEQDSAGVSYRQSGISNLGHYFKKNSVLLVTGKIEQYKDTRSGQVRYQIRVKDPEQVRRQ